MLQSFEYQRLHPRTDSRGVLRAVRFHPDDLRNSEKKVALIVLESPDQVIYQSISELAENAGTSEPTVFRLRRRYAPGRYPGRLHLIRAAIRKVEVGARDDGPQLGWGPTGRGRGLGPADRLRSHPYHAHRPGPGARCNPEPCAARSGAARRACACANRTTRTRGLLNPDRR